MDKYLLIRIIVMVVLVLLSAFFSSAETAFVSANQLRMRKLAEEGNKKAARVIKITQSSAKMLSAILIGNNVVNVAASSIMTTIAIDVWGDTSVSICAGILTFVILIMGEITPKTIATAKADKLSLFYSPIISFLMIILTPFVFITEKMAKFFMFIIGFRNKTESKITEEELRTMVDVSHEEGVIESEEREMINNVFDFGDSLAKDVMIPRIDMSCFSIDSSYEEVLAQYKQDRYTRYPVYEDTIDNVIGIINVKDLLLCEDSEHFSLHDILRKPYFTYEFKDVSGLLEELKKTSSNFAIVVDEYGATVGMITLEDLLEEIVGEIRDEYDYDEEDDIKMISENEYIISGTTRLDDLRDFIPFPNDEDNDEYDSLGGLFIKELGQFPSEGDFVELPMVKLVAEKCDNNRIVKVHVYIYKNQEEGDSENGN